MTDLLKDTLTERADSVEPPPFDLDEIIAAGDRRLTRRRALTIFGGTAVALAGGGLAVAASRKRHLPPPFAERRVTYAVGSEIHYGDEVISVAPQAVIAFVQTDAGFVFLNAENAIHVVDRSGVRSLGKSTWRLVGDGNRVAWVESFNDHVESVVYDVAARRELVRTGIGNKIPPNLSLAVSPRVAALDGNHAYFGTLQGLYRWDLITNQGELVAKLSPDVVRAVTAGEFVFQQPLNKFRPHTLAAARTVNATAPARFTGEQAFLSPAATYLVTQLDDAQPGIQPLWADLQLYEVASGSRIALPNTYVTKYFGQWLDDTTCTLAGQRPNRDVDLLVVDARTGAVRTAVPKFTKLSFSRTPPRTASIALPTGAPIIDL
ncbi:hypothetical protein [Kribbella sp. NPDC051137]|uniref:hypothetical protein n=1 Tax=Kribbella sp. NPDC051137 TaxID=3155045 RepID=UPI002F5C434C